MERVDHHQLKRKIVRSFGRFARQAPFNRAEIYKTDRSMIYRYTYIYNTIIAHNTCLNGQDHQKNRW